MEALAGMSFANAAVRAYAVFELRQFGQARDDQIARGTWYRCNRCDYAWRGVGQTVKAMLRRPPLDAEVVKSDVQPLPELARAPRPEPTRSTAPSAGGAVRRTAAPTTRRLSSSDARLPDQGLKVDEHWLAGVEARFEASGVTKAGRALTVDASVASDVPARDPDPRVAPEPQPGQATKANAHRVDRPQVSMDPTGDHWLAGVEAAYELGYVSQERPSATGCPAPDESSSVSVCRSEAEDVPASLDIRVEMDDWFDDMEEVIPLLDCRVERPEHDTEARRPGVRHPAVPGVTALQDHRKAPVPMTRPCVATR